MPSTFTWNPSLNFTKKSSPRVNVIQYDNSPLEYRKRTGINLLNLEWELAFSNKPIAEANEIINFLKARGGCESFYFTPPGSTTTYLVIASEWDIKYESHISITINTKFTKVNDIL
jgi:phage-related protein